MNKTLVLGLIALLSGFACLAETEADSEAVVENDVELTPEEVRALRAIPGRWQQFQQRPSSAAALLSDDAAIEQLEAMGYLSGENPAHAVTGIVRHDKEKTWQGLNFYVSGHAPVAMLTDMDGKVLHKWGADLFEVLDAYKNQQGRKLPNHWRRARLYPNGDVIGVYGGYGMVKIDKDSKVLWGFDEHAHHDLDVIGDGTVYTLTREGMKIDRLNKTGKVVMDYVVMLNPDGSLKGRVNVFDCFVGSAYEDYIGKMSKRGDVLHTNTIAYLDGTQAGKMDAFAKGNLLISMRNISTIAVVDPAKPEIVWAQRGPFSRQHEPVLLDNGNILLFDNLGLAGNRSRILEIDPASGKTVWSYGEADDEVFFSRLLGSVQRLPNGNTLISESDNGRVFEVTKDREVVWEFVNPHRAGGENQFVASVYELIRLPSDFEHAWADPETAKLRIDISGTAR